MKIKYKFNQAANWEKSWLWLFLVLFLSPLLPEYIAPFVLTIGYIVFLTQRKKQKKKIKLGFQGKAEMVLLLYMLAASLWSATKLFSAAMAGLFFWMFLAELMIDNLCTSQEKLNSALKYFAWSASALGALGVLQFFSRKLAEVLSIKSIIPDPLYRNLDAAVFRILPFSVKDGFFDDRSSGTFTNPNLYTTILVIALPFILYFLMNAVTKKQRIFYLFSTLAIAGGVASSKSRIALIAILLTLVLSLFCFGRKNAKITLSLIVVACAAAVPMILTRFHNALAAIDNFTITGVLEVMMGGKSSRTHIAIWEGCIDYIFKTPKVFWIGHGGGTENSWNILINNYGINQPHAHCLLLEIWMQYGLIGVLLFLIPMIITVVYMVRLVKDKTLSRKVHVLAYMVICALISYNVTGITDFLFNSPKQVMLLFVLFGFGQALYRIYGKAPRDKQKSTSKKAVTAEVVG